MSFKSIVLCVVVDWTGVLASGVLQSDVGLFMSVRQVQVCYCYPSAQLKPPAHACSAHLISRPLLLLLRPRLLLSIILQVSFSALAVFVLHLASSVSVSAGLIGLFSQRIQSRPSIFKLPPLCSPPLQPLVTG